MKLIYWLKRQFIRHTLKKHAISYSLWNEVTNKIKTLDHLSSVEKAQLRVLATLFLRRKTMSGARGMVITDEVAIIIAAQASLPILKLGLDYYRGWIEVIVYPAAFQVKHEQFDDNGLASAESQNLSGESWLRGPVILSWQDIEHDLQMIRPGHNVIVHEFAHKIDMLNGRANGMPPLHPRMKIERWTKALSGAYETLREEISHHHRPRINAYAATAPAEFFAVVSEYFFTAPVLLKLHCPEVYEQLVQFYRQDPCVCKKQ